MAERVASLGYAAIGKETTKGTAVTPSVFIPYFDQNIMTDLNLVSSDPIIGNKYRVYQALQGQRTHQGTITTMAEPNVSGYFQDMLLNKVSTTGAGPYTHSFALNTTDPNSYTLDISLVSQVVRFVGVQVSKFTTTFNGNQAQDQYTVSALGSFIQREVASISTTSVTFTTTYDPNPTNGLVVGDLVKLFKTDGSLTTNFTISSITNGTTVVLNATAAAFAAGDMFALRPATPSTTLLPEFLWSNTQFCFGATASAALSAAQVRLDSGTTFEITHDFKNAGGEERSGAFDPASLVRTTGLATFKVKRLFDNDDQVKQWMAIAKNACVIRQYSSGTTYERRITLNNLKIAKNPIQTKFDEIIYHELEYIAQYDTSDAQGVDIKIINGVSTI